MSKGSGSGWVDGPAFCDEKRELWSQHFKETVMPTHGLLNSRRPWTLAQIVGALLVLTFVASRSAEGATCKKFKGGMTISDCPDEGCGKEGNLSRAKNRTDHASSPTTMSVAD